MKSIKIIIISIFALASAAACRKQECIVISPLGDEVGISAYVPAADSWSGKDSIFIWQSSAINGILRTADETGKGNFTGALSSEFNPDSKCWFVSNPESVTGVEDDTIFISVAKTQSGDKADCAQYIIDYSAHAIPVSNGDGSFHMTTRKAMQHLTTSLDLILPEGLEVKSLNVQGYCRNDKSHKNISGTLAYLPKENRIARIDAAEGEGNIDIEFTPTAEERLVSAWMVPEEGKVDSLALKFTNPNGIEKILEYSFDKALVAGQAIDLGKLKVSFPIPLPESTFSIKHSADIELAVSNVQAEHLYYTYRIGAEPEDPTEESAEWTSSTHIYPENDCYYKVLAVSDGCTSSLSKAHVRMHVAQEGFSITIPAGGSSTVGFATVTNSYTEDQSLATQTNGCYQIYKGGYIDFHFKALHKSTGELYLKLRNEKKVTFYVDNNEKGNYKNTGDTRKWYTHTNFTANVTPSQALMFRPNTNDTLIYGFAWLEQGF